MKKYIQVVLVFILAAVMVACGGGQAEETAVPQATAESSEAESQSEAAQEEPEPEPTATPAPTDTPQPTDTPEPTATPQPTATPEPVAAPEIDFTNLEQGLAQFDSYRLSVTINFTGTDPEGNEITPNLQIDIANVTDPPGTSVGITAEGIEEFEEFDSLAMAQIADTSYISLPGLGCITSTEEEDLMDSLGADFLDTSQFTGDLDEARFVGEEIINGIEVLHYEVDSSLLDENDQLEEVSGEIYVAKEGGYLVSMVLDGTGPVDFLGEGEDTYGMMHVEYNLTDINQAIQITLPPDCAESAAGGGSEFPVTEDAYELASFSGFTSYKTDLAFADVVEFYEAVMPDEGWTRSDGDSFVLDDTAVLVFTREEAKLSITIGAEDDDTQFVLLTSE